MAFLIDQIPDEQILIATGKGLTTGEDFESMFNQILTMSQDLEGKVYCIVDFTGAECSYKDVLHSLKFAAEKLTDVMFEAHIQPIYVGTSHWIGLARTTLEQSQAGSVTVQTFVSLEDALSYVHREISKLKGATGFLTNSDYFHRINSKDWKHGS